MKKKIYLNFFALVLLSALSPSLLFGFIHFNSIDNTAFIFISIILVFIAILIITGLTARGFIKNILNLLNEIDFDGNEVHKYDDFLPLIKKIEQQKNDMNKKILEFKTRTDTIETITENMREGLILIDKNGIILTANKRAVNIFKADEMVMVKKNIIYICRETEFQQGIKKCLAGINSRIPLKKDGRIYNVYFNPVYSRNTKINNNQNSEINGSVILFFDTTERYNAEKQRREFSANISHELKTPLTTVSALSEMIGNGMVIEEDIKEFAKKINVQTNRLINIVNDIIKLSEFDEGGAEKMFQSFDLYELAETVIEYLGEKAKQRNIKIELTGKHIEITANKGMIDELIFNLIDNGIKYNKDNGNVTVILSEKNGTYQISVRDTGIGIPKEHHKRLFERFYRVDKSRSKKTGGTGLGLSIVKHIAEFHSGSVELESIEGAGTTVTCSLFSASV